MGQGLGLGLSYGAAGAADELQDIIRRRTAEIMARQAQAERDREYQFRQQQESERNRQWALSHERGLASDKSLASYRDAEAFKDKAEADARKARSDALQKIVDDPNTPAPLRQLIRLNMHGVNNLGIHDVEGPLHGQHVEEEDKRKRAAALDDFKVRQNYVATIRANRPRPGKFFVDDPAKPRGAEHYIVSLATKHGGNFDAAARELEDYLQGSGREAHPSMSPSWARETLRQAHARPGGETERDRARQRLPQQPTQPGAPATAGGRGGGSGRTAQGAIEPTYRHPDGTTRAYPPEGGPATPLPPRPGTPKKSGMVKMRAPDGTVREVPSDQVDHYMGLGARIVTDRK